jgi:hypothetical protein
VKSPESAVFLSISTPANLAFLKFAPSAAARARQLRDDANIERGVGAQAAAAQVRCPGAESAQVFESFVLVQSEEGSDVLAGYFPKPA